MIIGFDAKKIVKNLTGIGNYSRGIVEGLARYYPDNQYLLFAPSKKETEAKNRLPATNNIKYVYPRNTLPLVGEEWWRVKGVVGDLQKCGVDIFHGLSNELPYGLDKCSCKKVVTIHDLIFLRMPHTYSYSARKILAYKTRYACRTADAIIAISERTKLDIMECYGIDQRKIHLVYQSCSPIFAQPVVPEDVHKVRTAYSLNGRYLLCVGTLQQRKNQIACVRALPYLPADIDLVLVGKGHEYAKTVMDEARRLNVELRVKILSNVPHASLPALFKGCSAFLYMSYYEGFGIPVLEAMAVGSPVVAASGSCLEEVGGDAALYCHPDDYQAIAAQINRILGSEKLSQQMVKAGYERASLFTPRVISDDIMKVYTSLLQ